MTHYNRRVSIILGNNLWNKCNKIIEMKTKTRHSASTEDRIIFANPKWLPEGFPIGHRSPLVENWPQGSVWPKQFSAVITAVIFGEITAETLSAILPSYGLLAETVIYGRNCYLRPKRPFSAENDLFRSKFEDLMISSLSYSFRRVPSCTG